ncbi:MAG TPA: hypothetical protein PLH72_12090 [Vicinamibacterales bacterium]|nr:hypothetical protein [Vicinamibacterales bacterium]
MNPRLLLTAVAVVAAGFGAFAADQKVELKSLPAGVQKAIRDETKGATLVGLSEEREDGKVLYEAETKVNGHTRDLLFDSTGALVEVEEEVAIDAVPAPVRSALMTRGKVLKIESLTKGGTVTYEAQVEKNGKKTEVVVDAKGNAVER